MNNYYTIEEKYLQAVEEIYYRDTARGLQLLKEIIENDPFYARAYFQLGKVYYYDLKDYQSAGYYFKTCMELEPSFPDNYLPYLELIVFLNIGGLVKPVSERALITPGVDAAGVYSSLGLFFEKRKNWEESLRNYQSAYMEITCKEDTENIAANLARVREKVLNSSRYQYHLTG